MAMIAGHATVDAADRDPYVTAHQDLVRRARQAPGSLDVAITADPLDPRSASMSSSAWSPASISMRGGLSPKRRGPRSSSKARHDVPGQPRPTALRSPRRRSISGKALGRDLTAGSRGATAGHCALRGGRPGQSSTRAVARRSEQCRLSPPVHRPLRTGMTPIMFSSEARSV